MNRLPADVERHLVSYMFTRAVCVLRCASRSFREASLYYEPSSRLIKGPLRYLIRSFPYVKHLHLPCLHYTEEDFSYLKNVSSLALESYIVPSYFKHTNLRSLELRGCTHALTDEMFDWLVPLQRLKIDGNRKVTNAGLKKLVNLTDLCIHCVDNITDEGLSTMSKLTKLDIYKINITDNVFQYLPELKELMMTFGDISIDGILQLKKLESLVTLSCAGITHFRGLDTLTSLSKVSLSYAFVNDEDLSYMKHVKYIALYCTNYVRGEGLQHLHNATSVSLHRLNIHDAHVDILCTLPQIKRLYLYECKGVSNAKKLEWLHKLPDTVHTDAKF